MRTELVRELRRVGVAAIIAACAVPLGAADRVAWRVDRPEVKITVPLKPGGAFAATTPALGGQVALDPERPGVLVGEIALDLSSIDTGIALRNQHLREKYLEVAKGPGYDRAVLSDIRLAAVSGPAFEGETPFTGQLLLHGTKKQIEGKAELRTEGAGRRVRAEFPLTLTDFGVEPPVYLGVGVGNKLLVRVQFAATPAAVPAR